MELNFKGLKMCKWNILTDKDQRADEKNWVIYLVIRFNPRVMAIKMSKMAHFLYIQLMVPRSHSFGKILKRAWNILLSSSRKCMVNRLLSYRSWNIKSRNRKKLLNQQKLPNKFFFKFWHLPKGTSESNNP